MPVSKAEILSMLDDVFHELAEHPPVFTIDGLMDYEIPHRERIAKNLFLRDDKKREYFIISVRPDAKADLKAIRRIIGSRPLSFASEEDLESMLMLRKGEVTPFGVLNDSSHRVKVFIDSFFSGGIIGVHPNTNTATVFLRAEDLLSVLSENGTDASFIDMDAADC